MVLYKSRYHTSHSREASGIMIRQLVIVLCCLSLAGWAPAQQSPIPPDATEQAGALLPEYRSDLQAASAWNRYSINATVDPKRPSLAGSLRLLYTNRDTKALNRLYFRLFPNLADFAGRLDISAVTVGGKARKVVYEQGRYLLRVDLQRSLAPGESVEVGLQFRTTAPANAGRSRYGAFNLQNSVLALASAYPIVAMVRDGIWDIGLPFTRGDLVNSETALYTVTLTAPADWTLVTTGSAIDGRLDAGSQTARFVSGPQRDFMIVATRLKAVTGDAGGTRVTSFYRAGNEAGGQAALRAAINAIQAFSKRYGRYPLAEFDVVPVDAGTFLGVEYPGMTLIEQRLYQNNPDGLEDVVAHEVAHQWWYSLVGNDVQNEPWLDEAFASYSEVIYAEEMAGHDAGERQLNEFRETYRAARAAGRDAAVGQPGRKIRSYFPIVYAKGALFFAALRKQIGDDAFNRFLRDYYAAQRYRVSTGTSLLASAEQACSCELNALYRDWIETAAPVAIP
jgi:hypothetical protein